LPTEPCCLRASTQSRSRTCKRSGLSRAALPVGVSGPDVSIKVVLDGIEPSFPACKTGVVAVGPQDRIVSAEVEGLEPPSGRAADCFQNSVLIQSDDFRPKLRELESNQRPPVSETGVTTNSNYPASFCSALQDANHTFVFALSSVFSTKLGEKESNLHHLVQSQVASPLAYPRLVFTCSLHFRRRLFGIL
jgi:hypothetical protein